MGCIPDGRQVPPFLSLQYTLFCSSSYRTAKCSGIKDVLSQFSGHISKVLKSRHSQSSAYQEHKRSRFLRNIGIYVQYYTASHTTKHAVRTSNIISYPILYLILYPISYRCYSHCFYEFAFHDRFFSHVLKCPVFGGSWKCRQILFVISQSGESPSF